MAKVQIPERLMILRYWVTKPGYLQMFANWERGQHDEGREIPDTFAFEMVKGAVLGGQVVDSDGNPVVGAVTGF